MAITLYLCACAFAIGQPAAAEAADGPLLVRLSRGQELYYRGSYTEETGNAGVQFQRSYRLENRVFVLNALPDGSADIACLTLWRSKTAPDTPRMEPTVSSVRLELGHLDKYGKITPNGDGNWLLALDGPPAIECGMFVPRPARRLGGDESWDIPEAGRPARSWHAAGTEAIGGLRCLKLVGVQQSEDWEAPRADHVGWRRQDTVWLAPRGGYAVKVERVIERREPARTEPNQRLVVKYELESPLQYPGQLFEDRRKEITQIHAFQEALTPLLRRAGEVGPRPFEAVQGRIKQYCNSQPPTPYREAIHYVEHLAEAGKRGEVPPEVTTTGDMLPATSVATPGRRAPDFLATNLETGETARLRRWLGQPVLLVFYNPASSLGEEVLRFAQGLEARHHGEFQVLAMAVSDDTERALKQKADMKFTFPILAGSGMRVSYGVDATPKMVVIDANGLVRGGYTGWGPETPRSVRDDLQRCQPQPAGADKPGSR
jgi:peroxiredoxin